MATDTLKKRYSYKLISNLVSFIFSFITAGIIPRALGVVNYGNLNFATTIINQIISLLDFRVSTCFYTKLAQRPNDNNLISFYFYYFLTTVLILTITIVFLVSSPLKSFVFPGQSISIIFYSLIFVVLNWYSDFLVRILDAKALTVVLEKQRVINKVVSSIFLLVLFFINQLNLITYFLYLYITYLFLILALYKKTGLDYGIFSPQIFQSQHRKTIWKDFYHYSSPLGIYVLLQFIQTVFDRWLLQTYGGSFEQGLYSFAFNLTNFCFIFITALIPLFTRELSITISKNDLTNSAKLFRQYVPLLYALTAFFCAFIFVEIKHIISIFGGAEYSSATTPLKILAFYPIISAYSNLNGSVIYANGNTKLFLKLGLIFTPIGMISSLVLLNENIIGINLGATGLAFKNVALEFISVLIVLKYITNYFHLRYFKYIAHMILSLILFIAIATLPHLLISKLLPNIHAIIAFLSSGIIYCSLILLAVIYKPIIFGLQKDQISYFFTQILNQIKNSK